MIGANVRTGDLEPLRRRFLLTGGFHELLNLPRDPANDEQTVLLQSQKVRPSGDGIGTLPLDLLLLVAGARAEREMAMRLAPVSPVAPAP